MNSIGATSSSRLFIGGVEFAAEVIILRQIGKGDGPTSASEGLFPMDASDFGSVRVIEVILHVLIALQFVGCDGVPVDFFDFSTQY
jgi:hypothetical protein